jgi:hypothetical protein
LGKEFQQELRSLIRQAFPEKPENLARKVCEPFAGFIASLPVLERPPCHEGRAEHALLKIWFKSFL